MGSEDFDDEMLMAYADGELDEASSRRVETAMAQDPAIAARVVLFQRTRRLARAAYAANAEEVPEALRRAVEAEIRGVARGPAAGVVVPFPVRRESATSTGARRRPLAMAAAAALAVAVLGSVAAFVLAPAGPPTGIAALADATVAAALSTAPSGRTVTLPSGELHPVQTFLAGDGSLCREFRLDAAETSTAGVACRTGGAWQVRFAAVAADGAAGGYQPAGAADGLDGYLAAMSAGEMMDPAAEAAALQEIR